MGCLLNFVDYTGCSCFVKDKFFKLKLIKTYLSNYHVIREIKWIGYDLN